jgi:hypothetical protein
MARVKITGTSPQDLQIEVDGQLPQRLVSFRLVGSGRDEPLVLHLELDVDEVEIDVEATVEREMTNPFIGLDPDDPQATQKIGSLMQSFEEDRKA